MSRDGISWGNPRPSGVQNGVRCIRGEEGHLYVEVFSRPVLSAPSWWRRWLEVAAR